MTLPTNRHEHAPTVIESVASYAAKMAERDCLIYDALVGKKAVVISTPNGAPAHSLHQNSFVYTAGETVTPDGFDEDRWNVCGKGIHFYITPEEAEAHY